MAHAPGSPPRGGSVWSTARSARRPAPSRGPAPAPPAEPSLKANESAAAGCAATTFPVFFLNSSGGGRSAAPSPRLSGNTTPSAPHGPWRRPAPPRLSHAEIARSHGPPGAPAAPPPRLSITPRGPAPLAPKPGWGGAGARVCVGAAAGGRGEGSGGKPGVEHPPPARPPPGVAPAAGLRRALGRTRARRRTCPAGTPRAQPSRGPPGCPDGPSLRVSTVPCFLRAFAGEPDGRQKMVI